MPKFLKVILFIVLLFLNPFLLIAIGIYKYCKWEYNKAKTDPYYHVTRSSSSTYKGTAEEREYRHYSTDENGRIYDHVNGHYAGQRGGNSIYKDGRETVNIDEFGRVYDYDKGTYVADIDSSGNVVDRATGKSVGRCENGEFRSGNRFDYD